MAGRLFDIERSTNETRSSSNTCQTPCFTNEPHAVVDGDFRESSKLLSSDQRKMLPKQAAFNDLFRLCRPEQFSVTHFCCERIFEQVGRACGRREV